MSKFSISFVIFLITGLLPAFGQISGDSTVCSGETEQYSGPVIPGASYSWNVAGGNITGPSNTGIVTIQWPNAGSGSIMLTVYLPDNTQQFFIFPVVVHPLPQPVITHQPYPGCPPGHGRDNGAGSPDQGGGNDCDKVCKGATITYSTTLNPGNTYLWTAGGASSLSGASTNTVTVSWDNSPFGFLTVYETNQWGCVDSATICIEKVDLPVAAFTHQLNVCKFSSVNFTNLSTGATSFQWYFGDGGNSTQQHPTHAYSNSGSYTITLIVMNDCFCADTFQSVIQVDSFPGPEISCPSTVCAFDTATYTSAAGNCTHNWFVTGGSITGPSNQPSVTVVWGAGQTGMLGLTVTGCGGTCSDTTWLIIPIIPANGTISGPPKVCPGECATYSLPKFSGATYSWSLNNGSCGTIQDSSCCEEITICWPATSYFCTDTLTVTFWDQFLGCGGTAQMIIRLRPELSIFGQTEGCSNGTSSFFAFGSINCMWNVSPAGPAYSPGPSPSLNVNWLGLTGNFQVTAFPVNPNQVCNDSATVLVKVIDPPAAPVITGDSVVCPGSVHQYCATGNGIIQWFVTGGNPSNGSGNCITVTWGNTPPFSVQAVVQMPQSPYCTSDPAILNINVPLNPPPPAFTGSAVACANAVSTYSTPTAYPAGANFTWSLSPSNAGTIISGQGSASIQIEWGNNAPQTVTLSLTVDICGQTVSNTLSILLTPAPNPSIIQPGSLCPGNPAQLNATGGVFTAYQWSGPGGFTSSSNPVTITQDGLYQVTVTDAGGCTALTQLLVSYTGTPVASISAQNPLSYCTGASYNVTLCALGNPNYTYAWSNAATSQCITVSNQGNFQVTVTDASNGCFAISNMIAVTESPCQPDTGTCVPTGSVSFTYSGCNPVSFLNTSVNAGSFSWNFGDLSSSTQTNPTHTYNAAGFFLVSLYGYVPDASGTDSCLLVDTALIEIPLLPRFTAAPGCSTDPVCFTDNSVFTAGNNITSWLWNFGDANTSTAQNPCHLYSTSGTFIVTLMISNGPCTTSWSDTIVVLPQPNAAFSFSNANCVNSPVFFNDLSASSINYWNWNFGNAGTSLNQNPAQAYTLPGTYPVTLIVHDINGCYDTATIPVTVSPNNLGGNITAFPDSIVCAGTPVILAAPVCAGCTYLWSNGSTNDSITVTTSGFYQVQVSDLNGCTYSTYIRVIVNQLPFAQIIGPTDACINDFVSLSVPYNPNWLYTWISNDTSANGQTGPGVWLTAASPGLLNFSVVLTDTVTGCTDTTAVHLLTVHPAPAPPVVTALTATVVCEGDSILLLMTHPDTTVSLSWSTGEVNDTLVVTKDGCYDAIATNIWGCSSTTTFCVTVNELPELCSFYEGCFDTCAPYTIAGPAGGSSYQWLLNGIPITGADSQYYTATISGAYSLIVTNSFGCTDTTGVLNLNLYPCPGDACVEFLIDTVTCDPATGQWAMQFHIINLTNIVLTEIHLQLLPPNMGAGYFPGAFIQTVQPGDTSTPMTTVISNAAAGDTLCFRTNVFTYNENNIEVLVCSSDTLCFVLPPCGNDTSCCYLGFVSDSIWCVTDPTGAPAYHFNIVVEGCGILDVQLAGPGNISLNGPYILNGGQLTLSGFYSAAGGNTLCLLFMMHDSVNYCADTIVCYSLPPCPPPSLPCEWGFDHFICAGQSSVFQHFYFVPGVSYNWQFPGGMPSTASGTGPHTVTYMVPGIYPVQLTMSNQQGSVICIDSITVYPSPVAGIVQSGLSLTAAPPGMSYQWYQYPVSQATLISGATQQSFSPGVSGTWCVVVMNAAGCSDTACIDYIHEDPCEGLQAMFSVNAIWLTAQFTDLSTAPFPLVITGWSWNFGDPGSGPNNTSSLPNPVHHYPATGYYLVCLTVTAINELTGTFCEHTICMDIYVKKRPKLVGTVVYLNEVLTPMPNTLVSLLSGGTVVAVDTTGPDGSWEFSPVDEGTYTLQVNTTKPWGGVNATDALVILKHFVQLSPLQGMKLQAANVDLNPVVNSIDALMVSRRFTGLLSSFLVGDWLIEQPVVNFTGDSLFQSIHALCFGDANGSYVPPALKPSPEIKLEQHGNILAAPDLQEINLPLSFSGDVQVSAISLVLDFPSQAVEILNITATSDPERLVYHVSDGQLRIAWFTPERKQWQAGEAVFALRLKLNEEAASLLTDDYLRCGNESSIADYEAATIYGHTMQYPEVSLTKKAFEAGQNIPNPFSGSTIIPWYQPEDGHIRLIVTDILGKEIMILHQGIFTAGHHQVELKAAGLERGIYIYRIEYTSAHGTAVESRRISLIY